MAGRMVGKMFLVALLFGVLLSSGVEARRLSQTVLSIETEDGRQRGNIQVDSEDGVAQAFSSSSGSGPGIASASASISSSPSGVSGEVGAIGGDADGFFQGVGGSISAPRPSRTPPPSPARPPRSTTSVSGSGTATTSVTGTGSASVGGQGSTSVVISGQTRTESTQEEEAENMDDAPAPVDDTEEEVEEIPEPTLPIVTSEPEPKPMPVEEVPAPQPVRVPSPPAPQPVKAESVVITTSGEEQEEEEEEVSTGMSTATEVSITTESGKQEVVVDGKSGPKVCLTSDTSMLEELLDEGYDVTILTPTRLGYEVTMMARSGYATSETSFLFDHVPEDVQELCNYDPATAPRPARRIVSNPNPADADAVLRDLCESRMGLYLPQILDACWSAGYLTLVDLVVLG